MRMAPAGLGGIRSPSTSFVGRREELASLRSLLAVNRLVTITGPGGSGKTRLAEELVPHVARSFERGIAVAYLASAGTPDEVAEVAMAAVGLHGSGDPRAALADYLGSRPFLLVLDNCEHVRRAAAELAADLQRACPGLVVVATSRRPLGIPGEQLFPIEGLSEGAAVNLLTERVRLASPSFVLTDVSRPVAADVCARLDGMPLAIELAAARLRHLGLADLAARLPGRIGDLGSEDSVAPARQRTLRGMIDWSHALLDEPQRILWRRLSAFVDGFTIAAAEAVAAFAPIQPVAVERLLGELVDRSMVAFDIGRDRYRLIEAMREYAGERLRDAGEQEATAGRHRRWMLDRALDLERRWWGPDQAVLLDAMADDAANLRAALDSALVAGDAEVGLRITTSGLWYWMTRASHAEAERWFLPFLGQTSDPALGAKADIAAAWMSLLSGNPGDCCGFLDRAENALTSTSDQRLRGFFNVVRAYESISAGELQAGVTLAHAALADPDTDPVCRSWARQEIEMVAFFSGDYEECLRAGGEAVRVCVDAGESWTRVPHLHGQAVATWQLGEPGRAASFLLDALRIDRRLDDIWHLAWSVEALGWITADLGRDERAARLLGIAETCWAFTGSSLTPAWQVYRDAAMATLDRRLGPPRFARELAAGRALDRTRALSYALDDAAVEPAAPRPAPLVSARELEVAALVAEGCANREIAERLFLSPRTVETHVQHLMDKLGVGSRAEVAAWHARVAAGAH